MDGKVFNHSQASSDEFINGLREDAKKYADTRNPVIIATERLKYEQAMEMTPEEFAKNYIKVKPKK